MTPKTHNGIYYFPSYSFARAFAKEYVKEWHNIISYELGWAIQLRQSGPYVGPSLFESDYEQIKSACISYSGY